MLQSGTYKIGAWFHSGRFADQRFDTAGQCLSAGHERSGGSKPVDFYFDTGLTYKGAFGREDDTIGIGFA